jgi:hypothetical protein
MTSARITVKEYDGDEDEYIVHMATDDSLHRIEGVNFRTCKERVGVVDGENVYRIDLDLLRPITDKPHGYGDTW